MFLSGFFSTVLIELGLCLAESQILMKIHWWILIIVFAMLSTSQYDKLKAQPSEAQQNLQKRYGVPLKV